MKLAGLFVVSALALIAAPAAGQERQVFLYQDSPLPADYADGRLASHLRRLDSDNQDLADVLYYLRRLASAQQANPPDLLEAVADTIRAFSQCAACRLPLDSISLSILNCRHNVHELCFLPGRGTCPICEHAGPHASRDRNSRLRELLKYLERRRWTAAPKIYPDSPLPLDHNDPDLQQLVLPEPHGLNSGRPPQTVLQAVEVRIVEAVSLADYRGLVELFSCSVCLRRCDSKSLAMLSCDHHVHEECFQRLYRRGGITFCPVCHLSGQHLHRDRSNFLRDTLRLFESKRWISGPRLYHDSPLAVDYDDGDLHFLLYQHDLPNDVHMPLIDALRQSVEGSPREDAAIRKFLRCPYCADHFHSSTVAILRCGHGIHKDCFTDRLGRGATFCLICGTYGPHLQRNRPSSIRAVLDLFESKQWIRPSVPASDRLYPGSRYAVDYDDPDLVFLVSAYLPFDLDVLRAAESRNKNMLAESLECSVCYLHVVPNNFDVLQCGHIVHATCVRSNSMCPYCPEGNAVSDREKRAVLGVVLNKFCDKRWMPRAPVVEDNESHQPHLAPLVHALERFLRRGWLPRSPQRRRFPNKQPLERILDFFQINGWISTRLEARIPSNCLFCQRELTVEDQTTLPCRHVLHRSCATVFMRVLQECPVCLANEARVTNWPWP